MLVRPCSIAVCVLILAASGIPGQSPKQSVGSGRAPFFTVDRSTLPPAVRHLPLERISSGGLMLLDRGGNLVRPPAARAGTAAPSVAVPLDARVGSNLRLGDDPPALPANMRSQAEPHIMRSPVNPDFLAATFQEGRFTDGGAVDCGYSITTDGGLNWTRALIQNLTQVAGGTYFRATDPVAGIDLSSNVYLNTEGATDASFNSGDILVSKSTNAGASFAAPTIVYHPPNGTIFPDKPWMAINTFSSTATVGRIVVTWTQFASGSPIVRSYSDNGGATWQPVAFVHSSATDAQGSQPVFLPNGNLVIPYFDFNGSSLRDVISTDGGVTFGTIKTITAVNGYSEPSIRSGGFLPSAVTDRTTNNVYLAYQGLIGGNPRIAFTKSTNGGNNWSAPIVISDNPAGQGVFNPAVAVSPDGQTLTCVFYDHRNNPGSNVLVDLYLSQSFDGGATWQPNIRLTSTSTDASLAPLTSEGYMLGDYQGVAESTNVNVPAVPVWIDTRSGNSDPFIARIGTAPQLNFTSWQAARLSLSQINNPLLGGINGNADFDAKINLLEYALGTEPLISDTQSTSIAAVNPNFTVTYPKLRGANDVTLHAFRSTDLINWTMLGVTETMTADGFIQTWQASTPVAGATKIFFRLQATQP
jgi:hypothetical protein